MLAGTGCLTPRQTEAMLDQVRAIDAQIVQVRAQQRTSRVALAGIAPVPAAPTEVPGDERRYRKGYALYHRRDYEESERVLRAFLDEHPDSAQADNAMYWIGETFFARGLYREAIAEFRALLERYPAGNKASHALYKMALCHDELGETAPARRALQAVIDRFPGSDVASMAMLRLQQR
jgi:tol-pal system protein YbgF